MVSTSSVFVAVKLIYCCYSSAHYLGVVLESNCLNSFSIEDMGHQDTVKINFMLNRAQMIVEAR